jgi:RNA polymerase sigma factor (TIGR02999 family)
MAGATSDERVAELLEQVAAGSTEAASELLPLVYDQLRRLAAARMARLRPGQTLQPTALVHEAYMDLVGNKDRRWEGRGHFFGAAAHAMREVLVDAARKKAALKRGGDRLRVDATLDGVPGKEGLAEEDTLALDDALVRLKAEHPRNAEVVVMRYYGGLTHGEIAEVLDVTERTVERDWRFARAWLHDALTG